MNTKQLSLLIVLAFAASTLAADGVLTVDDGYRGIWYMNLPLKGPYKFKYSGGLGTYPQQHMPIAIYAKQANKTFFCYGGRPRDKNELVHMVSYFDHATKTVPRPTLPTAAGGWRRTWTIA